MIFIISPIFLGIIFS